MNRKIRFSLEIEFENKGITDKLVKALWSRFPNYEEIVNDEESWVSVEYQKRLLEVLLGDKTLLEPYLTYRIMSEIDQLDFKALAKIAGLDGKDESSVLREGLQDLNLADRLFFEKTLAEEAFFENTSELAESFQGVLKTIEITDISEPDKPTSLVSSTYK